MAATVVYIDQMSFPYPLGMITGGASFATVSVPLTQNVLPTERNSGSLKVMWNLLEIRSWGGGSTLGGAPAGNKGVVWILDTASAPDTTAFSNVIDVLQPGEAWPRGKDWSNIAVDISHIFLAFENATDVAIANIAEF